EEFSPKYLQRHTPVYLVVNGLYLCAVLVAHPLPLLSYLIYIAVVFGLIVLLPNLDDGFAA
ncbi:MAG TPA: hypothetical protein PLL95_07445, partial [Anaerolineales bacterium]|nr:hypothetical protein [Anaerolineales bacterium]